MSKVSIRNNLIIGLASWLNEQPLSGFQSRERTRFVQKLVERHNETENFRKELIEKYSKKDEEGKQVKADDGESIVLENVEEFMKEAEDLYSDEFVLDMSTISFKTIKDIVLNTTYVFGPKESDDEKEKIAKIRQANDYNAWCECFEEKVK